MIASSISSPRGDKLSLCSARNDHGSVDIQKWMLNHSFLSAILGKVAILMTEDRI